ncbi:MAG: alpha-L-arabinofuranosidase C-terminal domain-containing protein [Thermoproteota archaeon]
MLWIILTSLIVGSLYTSESQGQEQVMNVEIRVTNDKIGEIDPKIYGHFIEHLGRCIYGGVWVGGDSKIPNLRGLRLDVLNAAKAISPPIIRWPGGCFADGYHWKDGIGPRDKRPIRPNLAWGGVESNQFGTDEFIDFCREVGAEACITVNVGSGTPQEAAEWVEYCNGGLNTTYGRLRAEYGHPEPYGVKYWGIGNELYGSWEIGHMDADTYARKVIEFAEAMRKVDPSIKIIAVGWFWGGSEGEYWNRKVLEVAGDYIDYLSLHTYCWKPGYTDYYAIVNFPLNVEYELKETVSLINSVLKNKPGKETEIALDEWGVWYENATDGLSQSVRLCDGLLAAGMFHVFHRLCNNVTMANFAQLVNALPAIVTNDRGEMYVNPIYLAFKLYRHNTGEIVLKTSTKGASINTLDVSATIDKEGNFLYLAVINKDPDRKMNATIVLKDFKPKPMCKASQLNGPGIFSKNDFKSPDVVKITTKYVTLNISNGVFTYTFEPHSATILVLESITSTATPTPEAEETTSQTTDTLTSETPVFQEMPIILIGVAIMTILVILLVLKTRKPLF